MTPAEAKAIFRRHRAWSSGTSHPLDGKNTAQWVAEARKPHRAPRPPKDPIAAGRKIAEKYPDDATFEVIDQ